MDDLVAGVTLGVGSAVLVFSMLIAFWIVPSERERTCELIQSTYDAGGRYCVNDDKITLRF